MVIDDDGVIVYYYINSYINNVIIYIYYSEERRIRCLLLRWRSFSMLYISYNLYAIPIYYSFVYLILDFTFNSLVIYSLPYFILSPF